ncbi:hypothetical protein RBH94_10340 [Aestuariibaculum sp. YM273]|uniref:hypothetical protein n=1 Tax=Aestuariibaculum sp. YM273 TaxID=3070659 RepID=UPI0027DCB1F3|nr:hypothetical protein [Aestuariibaculum sp. YM273]WMI64459.1 hypothetical protein RBH94_10340 [Aestuariibaculum sp. YM273]
MKLISPKFPYILLVAITLLNLLNCTYDFSEDYFEKIKVYEPNVIVKLNGFTNEEETHASKVVKYAITGFVSNEFEMVVKVNDKEIYRSYDKTGEFYLYVDELDDGKHNLTIEYLFPTNSGSLANVLDAEFYTGGAAYVFNLDKTLATPLGIDSINIIEGSIYINLNPIVDYNFVDAFLVIKNENDYIIEERPISQEDLTDLVIHDDKTIIYNPSYAIKIKNAFREDISDFVLLPTAKMNFILEYVNYYDRKMTYNAHPFYGNFDTIIMEYYDANNGGNKYHSINPLGDEVIIHHNFGWYTNISIYYPILKFYKNGIQIERIADIDHKFQNL